MGKDGSSASRSNAGSSNAVVDDASLVCEVLPLLAGRTEVQAPKKLKFKVHPTRD